MHHIGFDVEILQPCKAFAWDCTKETYVVSLKLHLGCNAPCFDFRGISIDRIRQNLSLLFVSNHEETCTADGLGQDTQVAACLRNKFKYFRSRLTTG